MGNSGVKFYSEYDMSTGHELKNAEKILQNWDGNSNEDDINKVLEFYNIKQFFDKNLLLASWNEETIEIYKSKCEKIPALLGRFFATVSDYNLNDIYISTDHKYIDDFWQLICDYKVYERFSEDAVAQALDSNKGMLWHILLQKRLVMCFGKIIAERLIKNCRTAEWLISHFLAAHDQLTKPLHFPVEFTQEMRDRVLNDYVDLEEPNPNYIQLLAQAQSSKEFPVGDRLRLKARKKGDLLQDKLFSNNSGVPFGVKVIFKSIPSGVIEEGIKEHIECLAYSHEWIEENQDYPTLLNNFIHLFGYVDSSFCCNFTTLRSELNVVERTLGIKGKKDYEIGSGFVIKSMRTRLQMQAYRNELQRLGIRLEDIFKWFFETYLKEEFNAKGFSYNPPSEGTTYAEKCKLLAISIDGILKQYRLFCEDGYVNRELLEMSSGHIKFNELNSLRKDKYAYSDSKEIRVEQNLLYSDQSMMTYTEKTNSKYRSLPQMLICENMGMEDFQDYQKGDLRWLIERGVVLTDENDRLIINRNRAIVLRDLFKNEVLCPAYYDDEQQKEINKLVTKEDIRYENTLFSKPEQDYLNYILNKSQFSNGLDLRNKYSHDTNSLNEKTQFQDYIELLKIMVLIIIKINEEFCLRGE